MTFLSGPALHSGVPSTVRVARRSADGLGIRFLFPGFAMPLMAGDLSNLRRSAHRATVLEDPGTGARLGTPEHLIAAALFFADAPLDLICDAAEPPGLDGSALPWFELLSGFAAPRAPREYEAEDFVLRPAPRQARGPSVGRADREIRATRAPCFSVAYELERGRFRDRFELASAREAPDEILPARTFIFWKDWRALATKDGTLLRGADRKSGILLAESPEEFASARDIAPELEGNAFPLLHPSEFRMEAEAARHKILDLLGDLALNGLALPKLRLEVRNGGHDLNHRLLDVLRPQLRSERP